MGCLFAVFAGMFPRAADIILWIARPAMFTAPFGGSWVWPLLGIIFLPFTTLMFVLLWSPGVGLIGWDYFWIIISVFLDISHWASSAYVNRDRMPGYAPA